ncbi:MAG: hypothetical protein M3O65_11975, partial [Actinomycetota bacterium]|nr:hypothetical protein [Actinomycetota bacterium]
MSGLPGVPRVAAGTVVRVGASFLLVVAATLLAGIAGFQVLSTAILGPSAPVLVPSGPVPVVPVLAGIDPPAAVRVRAVVVTAGAVLALLAAGPAGAGRPVVGVRRPGLAWTRDRRHPGPLARVGLVAVRPPPG